MTPEQALGILYQASRIANLSATDHDKCGEALKVLEPIINSVIK